MVFISSKDPILINGLNNARQYVNIPQDPSLDNSITISRSVNEKQGMEFTWSIWMYIDDFNGYKEQYKRFRINIILEGDNNGKIFPINAPGLYMLLII